MCGGRAEIKSKIYLMHKSLHPADLDAIIYISLIMFCFHGHQFLQK